MTDAEITVFHEKDFHHCKVPSLVHGHSQIRFTAQQKMHPVVSLGDGISQIQIDHPSLAQEITDQIGDLQDQHQDHQYCHKNKHHKQKKRILFVYAIIHFSHKEFLPILKRQGKPKGIGVHSLLPLFHLLALLQIYGASDAGIVFLFFLVLIFVPIRLHADTGHKSFGKGPSPVRFTEKHNPTIYNIVNDRVRIYIHAPIVI